MPASRGPADDPTAGALAARLGVAADATADQVAAAYEQRMRDERLVGAIAQRLGLPLDAASSDVLAAVDGRIEARAKAVGLPSDATFAQIVAAETASAATKATAAPTPPGRPASAAGATDDYDAEVRRLTDPFTVQDGLTPHEQAAIDVFATTGINHGSNGRTPGEPSDPKNYR